MSAPFFPILRRRLKRRARERDRSQGRLRRLALGFAYALSALLAFLTLGGAWLYADLTRDLPSIETLPLLLSPPDGALLQPTRLYDRTGEHLLLTLAPTEGPRRYIPLDPQNPQHLPRSLADATILLADPDFWEHPGYLLSDWQDPNAHPTIAQRLVADLLLWDEPPSIRRALRERLLAAQITARYGRTQVLEWYLNSTDYGHYAYGAEAAARLYLHKSATNLTPTESALLAAISQAPALNPLDAPQVAYERALEVAQKMFVRGILSEPPPPLTLPPSKGSASPAQGMNPAPAFTRFVLSQLSQRYDRARLERGGLRIVTTLDYDLQLQAACAVQTQVNRMAGDTREVLAADGQPCRLAHDLPPLPPQTEGQQVKASAVVLDPRNGQVLALVGETGPEGETASFDAHTSGSLLVPFIYLTGFTRGLGPASLLWDIPGVATVQNADGRYHGPMRLRMALANDYLVPAAQVLAQMGEENVRRTMESFGLAFPPESDLLSGAALFTPVEIGGAYGVFATQGIRYGQKVDGESLQAVGTLRVESVDHALWLDWSEPEGQAVVTPQLAYLMTHVLSDETARWPSLGYPNPLEIGRPAGAKTGQTFRLTPEGGVETGPEAWAVGYTPQRVAVVWMGGEEGNPGVQTPAGLWHALMRYAVRNLPPEGWDAPPGVTTMEVCDPSGLLPTADCPNVVQEVFLNGNEPQQVDTLYRTYEVNRETGLLATIFTPPQLVEERVYMVVPPEAEAWARSAGVETPPKAYDAIQQRPRDPDAHITSPAMFADLRGVVTITGTAAGEGFQAYRVLVGQGLNPQAWVQIGEERHEPVEEGVLAEWDTSGLSGLYAVQLVVMREEQRVETAVVQVNVDNEPPRVNLLYPKGDEHLKYIENRQVTFQVQADDNMSLAEVAFYVDGDPVGVLNQPPFTLTWLSHLGKHTLRVVARDRAGNQAAVTVRFEITR
ncbi:MAG: penicillin-binding protein [Anaerolineae bacterium]|nr:MAG: penicillin-binding protein [Anaerolineae bacterium]